MRKLLPVKSNMADGLYLEFNKPLYLHTHSEILHGDARSQNTSCPHDAFQNLKIFSTGLKINIWNYVSVIKQDSLQPDVTATKIYKIIALKWQISLW